VLEFDAVDVVKKMAECDAEYISGLEARFRVELAPKSETELERVIASCETSLVTIRKNHSNPRKMEARLRVATDLLEQRQISDNTFFGSQVCKSRAKSLAVGWRILTLSCLRPRLRAAG
jgi:hypothetical protein